MDATFTHYTKNVALNYKNILFVKWGNHTHRYMLKPILLMSSKPLLPCNLAHMHCDIRRGIGAQVMGVVEYATLHEKVQVSGYHTLIQSSVFAHIQLCFPHIYDQT